VTPTISACIAVYNGADHLATAIRSVLAQTKSVNEVIVLDDGSSDDSVVIARGFEGVRVMEQANAGIGAARKALVEAAKGDWIAFCDHDDWWEPNRIEVGAAYTKPTDVSLIYSGVWQFDEHGVETEYLLHAAPDAPAIDHLVPHPEDIWTSSTLIRREAALSVGNFNPHYRTGEDMLMWFQLGSKGRIVQIPQKLVHMARRSDSTSAPSKSQFEYAVSLYEREVLPNLDSWYPNLSQEKRADVQRQLERKVGYTMSVLGNHYDLEGNHPAAMKRHRQAIRLCPKSKGVWYRYMRSLFRIPGKPPI
jgi:glycosyltransferase involved in cell wall biosynthesis